MCVCVCGGMLVEEVFVQAIDCSFVRSNVTGLRQTNIDVEAAEKAELVFFADSQRETERCPSAGLLGFAVVHNGTNDKTKVNK